MRKFIVVLASVLLLLPVVSMAKLKAPDVLDKEKIKTDEGIGKDEVIGVKPFNYDDVSYDNVDDEEMKKMKRVLPEIQEKLAKSIKFAIEDRGFDAFVISENKGADKADLILEGEITKVNLGSAAARFWVGMGAGQAGITVTGRIKDAKTGDVLFEFEHENTSGLSGGEKWTMVLHEAEDLGDKIGDFVKKLGGK